MTTAVSWIRPVQETGTNIAGWQSGAGDQLSRWPLAETDHSGPDVERTADCGTIRAIGSPKDPKGSHRGGRDERLFTAGISQDRSGGGCVGRIRNAALAAESGRRPTGSTLGKSSVKVTRLAYGTGSMSGQVQRGLGQKEFTRQVRYAYDQVFASSRLRSHTVRRRRCWARAERTAARELSHHD